ncbi:MAG: endonuclease MutS2, partial [Niallia sp.]
MQDRVLKTLEFDKIKAQLMEHVSSSLGRNKVEDLVPSTDYNEVVRWQDETDEAAKVYRMRGTIPLDGIYDIGAHVKRSSIGGMLSPVELNHIASTVHASRQMKRFIEEFHEEEAVPFLFTLTDSITVLADVEEEIKMAIDEQGSVLDSASDTLRTLRNQ